MPSPSRMRLAVESTALAVALAVTLTGCAVETSAHAAARDETAAASPHVSPTATTDPSPAPTPTPTDGDQAAPASIPQAQVVVTIGDSIMAGYGLDDTDAWPQLLATGTPSSLVNLACSGAGFIAVGSCGTDYAGLIPEVEHAHPTLVIVESSSNDMGQSDAAIDEATQATMAALRAAAPNATIVALSTVWNEDSSWPDEVTMSSESIERAATAQHALYLDLGQPLEGHPEWMQSDDVHPTIDGQRVLAEAVRRALAADGLAL